MTIFEIILLGVVSFGAGLLVAAFCYSASGSKEEDGEDKKDEKEEKEDPPK